MRRWPLVFLLACRSDPRATWPALPGDEQAAQRLIAERTRRPSGTDGGAADDAVRRLETTKLVIGLAAIDAWMAERARRSRSFYMLWGTHHDSAAQIDAFRRLTGPGATTPWTFVALEQLRADGRWAGIPLNAQRGDDDALRRWSIHGSPEALTAIATEHERADYAAWKFGYLESVLDVIADARTTKHEVLGCDMPRALQAKVPEPSRNDVRELHCALALGERRGPGAILWGAEHVRPNRFARFLPPDADVLAVRVVGGRPETAQDPIQAAVTAKLDIVEPVLSIENDAVIVLADPAAARHFERRRDPRTRFGGNLYVAGAPIAVDGQQIGIGSTRLAEGIHALAAPRANRTLLASFVIPRGGWTEIQIDETEPEVTVTVHAP